MPLLDHFHAPLYPRHSWESFHARWAPAIADALDRQLPPRYFAEVQVHVGSRVEADVAEFERPPEPQDAEIVNGPGGGVALQSWAPPHTALHMPAVYPDDIEVQVFDERDDARLVAVVELVSPANKDRPETRRAFAVKTAAYLQRGIGVIVADVVTSSHFNLHNELVHLLGLAEPFLLPIEAFLYAAAYRPVRRHERNEIDLWPYALTIGGALPLLPLGLRGTFAVPVDLEATYSDARQRSRL